MEPLVFLHCGAITLEMDVSPKMWDTSIFFVSLGVNFLTIIACFKK